MVAARISGRGLLDIRSRMRAKKLCHAAKDASKAGHSVVSHDYNHRSALRQLASRRVPIGDE
jgi:hypothetical protein